MIIKAHPTIYAGVTFRSRLEATWAAFFDKCGWRWEYEPVDAEGWVPDFFLFGHEGPLPVEVKPIDLGNLTYSDVINLPELQKVWKSESLALIVGLGPTQYFVCDDWLEAAMGVLVNFPTEHAHVPSARMKTVLIERRYDNGHYDFFPRCGQARYFIRDTTPEEWPICGDFYRDIMPLWGAAKLATQWRPPHAQR